MDNIFLSYASPRKRMAIRTGTHLVFIDLSKAYDSVPVRKLWEVLEGSPISISVIKAIKHLYENSNSRIKLEFPVTKGLAARMLPVTYAF
jgi:hypothetical protein